MSKQSKLFIAQVGRTVGLHGDLKLHLHTDFPQQFKTGSKFDSSHGDLEIARYDHSRGIVRFVGFASRESARELTNTKLYSTPEQTLDQIELDDGEHFWFEIIGSAVVEDGEILGEVEDIDRMLDVDYLSVSTSEALVARGLPKSFLLPYIPRYIVEFDAAAGEIRTIDARDILEAS